MLDAKMFSKQFPYDGNNFKITVKDLRKAVFVAYARQNMSRFSISQMARDFEMPDSTLEDWLRES